MCVFIYMKLHFTSRGLFILLAERLVRFVLNNILIYTLIYSINKILKINNFYFYSYKILISNKIKI